MTAGIVVLPNAAKASTRPKPQTNSNCFPSASGRSRRRTTIGSICVTMRELATNTCDSPRLNELESRRCVTASGGALHAGALSHLHKEVQVIEAVDIQHQAVLRSEDQPLG